MSLMLLAKKIAKLTLSLAILAYLVHSSHIDIHLLHNLFKYPIMLLALIMLNVASILISAWRWKRLSCVQGYSIPYESHILPTYLGIAMNNLLPGGVAGDFYRFYFKAKHPGFVKKDQILILLVDRAFGLMGAIFVIGAVSAFMLISQNHDSRFDLWYFIAMAFNIFIIFAMCLYFSEATERNKDQSRVESKREKHRLLMKIGDLYSILLKYKKRYKALSEAAMASILIQGIIIISCVLCAGLLGMKEPTLPSLCFAVVICQIVNLLPFTPGGLGVGEVAFSNVLGLMNPGFNLPYATIYLVYRLIGYLFYLPSASVLMFNLFGNSPKLQDER